MRQGGEHSHGRVNEEEVGSASDGTRARTVSVHPAGLGNGSKEPAE